MRRRRRLLLVRPLTVVGLCCALVLIAVAAQAVRAHARVRQAISMINDVDGSVGVWTTKWGSPTSVSFEGMGRPASSVTDRELMAIADLLCGVETLGLENTGVSTAAIAYFLTRHPTITRLGVHGTAVDDSLMPFLERLPNLDVLDIGRTRIGDESAPALAQLPSLRTLVVCGSELSAIGLDLIRAEAPMIHLVTHSRRCVFGDPLGPGQVPDAEQP